MFASPYIMPASRRGAQPAPVQMFKERKGSPPPYTVLPNTFLYGPRPQDRGTEVKNMRSHIKKASSKNPYPHRRAVIGVVADDWSSFDIKDAVPQRLSSSLKRLAYGMLGEKQSRTTVNVSTVSGLQNMIKSVEERTDCSELVLVVHSEAENVRFDITHGFIRSLILLQCRKKSSPIMETVIDGSSTYAGKRLDEINRVFDRDLFLGTKGISVSIDRSRLDIRLAWFHKLECASTVPVEQVKVGALSGQTSVQDFNKSKSTIMSILELVTGSTEGVFKISPRRDGIVLRYVYENAETDTKSTMPSTILCGADAGAYFITWADFFHWLFSQFFVGWRRTVELPTLPEWLADFETWVKHGIVDASEKSVKMRKK